MDDREIARVLEEQHRDLTAELAALTEVRRDPTAVVSFGKRVGDGTIEAVERIHQTSAAKALAGKLADVERAQAKLSEGTYGTCDSCSAPIPPERLQAMPWAVLCVSCSAARADA